MTWKLPNGNVVDDDGLYDHLSTIVDRDYGSLEEFGIEPVDDGDSSDDCPEAVIAEGGQD